ncbi:hypothetical protein ACP70R_005433 [Stipagrostis hirtigluma subsp. patula]
MAWALLILQMSSSSNGHYPVSDSKVLHKRENKKEEVQLDKNESMGAYPKDRQYTY